MHGPRPRTYHLLHLPHSAHATTMLNSMVPWFILQHYTKAIWSFGFVGLKKLALNVGLLESLEEISKGKLIQNRRVKGNLNMRWSRDYQGFSQLYWGAFHSTSKSGLNFRQLPVANGAAFSKVSKKKGQTSEVFPRKRKFSFYLSFSRNF